MVSVLMQCESRLAFICDHTFSIGPAYTLYRSTPTSWVEGTMYNDVHALECDTRALMRLVLDSELWGCFSMRYYFSGGGGGGLFLIFYKIKLKNKLLYKLFL